MRRALLLGALFLVVAGGLAVGAAVLLGDHEREPTLSRSGYLAMELALAPYALSGPGGVPCSGLPDELSDGQAQRIRRDCEVSADIVTSLDRLERCGDRDCRDAALRRLTEVATESAEIEEEIAGTLEGDCARLFEIEAAYGRDMAEAAKRWLVAPREDAIVHARFRRDQRAAEANVPARLVERLLPACRPD